MAAATRHRSAVLAAIALGVSAIATGAPIDPVFFSPRTIPGHEVPAISGDGRRLAFTVKHDEAHMMDFMASKDVEAASLAYYAGASVQVLDRASKSRAPLKICPEAGDSWAPAWSPEGEQLAFYANAGSGAKAWIFDAKGGSCRQISSVRVSVIAGEPPKWTPDGKQVYVMLPAEAKAVSVQHEERRSVFVLSTDPEEGIDDSVTRKDSQYTRERTIVALDVQGDHDRKPDKSAGELRASAMRLSPSGAWLSVLSVNQQDGDPRSFTRDLFLIAADGGEPISVAQRIPELWNLNLSYVWHPAKDLLVYWKQGGVWLIDATGSGAGDRDARRLAPELGPVDSTLYAFTKDGASLIVGSDPAHEQMHGLPTVGPRKLAIIPLDGGEPTQVPIDGSLEFVSLVRACDGTAWQPEPETLTMEVLDKETGQTLFVRANFANGRDRVLWRGYAHFENLCASRDHSQVFAVYEDMKSAPGIDRFDSNLKKRERMTTVDPRLDGIRVGSGEVFSSVVPLYDGSLGSARAAVLLPDTNRSRIGPPPAVVMLYPGSNVSREIARYGGGSVNTIPNLVLTTAGYAVLLVDVPLGPEHQPSDLTKHIVDIVLAQVYRAAALGFVDVRRLAISGQSFGGFAAAAALTQTNLFRASVAINGMFDLGAEYGRLNPDGTAGNIAWAEGGQARMGGHLWGQIPRYIENSPYYRADKIQTPLLLLAGSEDSRVPMSESSKLYTALRRLDRPAQLAIYPGQGHVVWSWHPKLAADASRRMLQFLDSHLGEQD